MLNIRKLVKADVYNLIPLNTEPAQHPTTCIVNGVKKAGTMLSQTRARGGSLLFIPIVVRSVSSGGESVLLLPHRISQV